MTRPGDVVAGGLLAAVGIGVCARAVGLRVGSALDPQPGFFPFAGGILLVTLAALLGMQGFRGTGRPSGAARESVRRPAILVAGLGAHAALLEWAGYPLMTALVALLILRVLETRWIPGVVASVVLSLGSYLLFVKLGVPLPPGQLFGG